MSLGLNWTKQEQQTAVNILTQETSVTDKFKNIQTPTLPGNAPDPDPEDFGYDGPGLALYTSDGGLADQQTLDFGGVDPNLPVTKTLTLTNFGGQPAVIRSIDVTQGFDNFSVPQIPVTTLQPGQSLSVPITFHSTLNIDSVGVLVMDADAFVFGGTVALHGMGQAGNVPNMQVKFYNNVGAESRGRKTRRQPILQRSDDYQHRLRPAYDYRYSCCRRPRPRGVLTRHPYAAAQRCSGCDRAVPRRFYAQQIGHPTWQDRNRQ